MYQAENRVLMIVISIASAVCSLSIIVSYAFLPKLREKKLFELLLYMALSLFLTSIGSSLGIPRDGSADCWFSGIVTNVFTLSSIFWTFILSLTLYHIVRYATMIPINLPIHLFCWITPFLISLIPLVEVRYGSEEKEWCFFNAPNSDYPDWKLTMWEWLGFYLWVFGTIFAITFLLLMTSYYGKSKISSTPALEKMFSKLVYYPFIIIICWVPSAVYDTGVGFQHSGESYAIADIISTILACSQGTLVAATFWYQNSDVIRLWKDACFQKKAVSSDGPGFSSHLFNDYKSQSDPDFLSSLRDSDLRKMSLGNDSIVELKNSFREQSNPLFRDESQSTNSSMKSALFP